MGTASLVSYGWVGLALLGVYCIRTQVKMLAMWVVFQVYRTPRDVRNKWLLREAHRNDKVALAQSFLNRTSRRPQGTPTRRR